MKQTSSQLTKSEKVLLLLPPCSVCDIPLKGAAAGSQGGLSLSEVTSKLSCEAFKCPGGPQEGT